MYVEEKEQKLAEQALADATIVEKLSAPANLNIVASTGASQPAGTAASTWRGYIGHLIVMLVALVAGAVIVKVMLLSEEEGWEKVG